MSLKLKQKDSTKTRERNSESECLELLKSPNDSDTKTYIGKNPPNTKVVKVKCCYKYGKYHAGKCPVSVLD